MLLGIYEQRAEEHLSQVDDERKDALRRLSKVEGENKDNAVLIARLRERLTTGGTGRISEQILTTLGAALFGVGISDLIAPQHHHLANALTITGAFLLLAGWVLAIFAIVRNKGHNLMFLPPISELSLRGVADRGIPNRERILIYSFSVTDLQNFILGIGYTADDRVVTPFRQYVYYFDDIVVPAQSWIVVYTGPGQTQVSRLPVPGNDIAFIYHWGFLRWCSNKRR
jgi:hypothetical protein